MNLFLCFDVLLTVHLSIFISVINQLGAQNFCFAISLFHASTCFEHMCSSSGGQNCITQASGIIVIPDGCITLIQFYLGLLVLVYLLCDAKQASKYTNTRTPS